MARYLFLNAQKTSIMKKILYLLAVVFSVSLASAQEIVPQIKFESTEHNFGDNPQGKPVTCEFVFTNTGTEPLVLESVKASCGCTTPDWTKEPVMQGKTGTIKVQYNMAREGFFKKSVTVVTKGGETVILYITGNATPQRTGVDQANPTIIGGGK
jgi:hypothetical protein